MSAPLVTRTDGDTIPSDDHNDVKSYIEDGTYRVNTKSLNIQGVGEIIDSSGNITTTVGTIDGIDIATDVTANTAKVTNASHTGEVTGSTSLTITNNIIDEANMKISNAPTNDYVLTADSAVTGGWKWAAASSGFADPMTTRGDIIIKDASNNTTRLAIGTTGQYLKSDGTDISWATISGGGDVTKVGTPVNNQVGVWTGDGTIEGDADFTFDGTNLIVGGNVTASFIGNLTGASSQVTLVDQSTDTTCFVTYSANATGSNALYTGTNLTFNASTGILTATGFNGDVTGNVTGDVTGNLTGASSQVTLADQSTDTTCSIIYSANATGNNALYTGSNLTFNSSTGTLNTSIITTTGSITAGTNLIIGSASISETELEILDGATLTTTELNYVDGVTSSIQTQLDAKGTMDNLVDDTTPELGGELDSGAHSIGFTQQTATGDGATTIDWKLGNKFQFTFGAFNETFTFTNPSNPCNILLKMVQDGTGSRTATFPASVKWVGGTAPTLSTAASSVDIISFYFDGTNYYGVASLDFS